MSQQQLVPDAPPWRAEWAQAGLILVTAQREAQTVTVAACDGTRAEANAVLICAAPDMMVAILAGDLEAARAALTERGIA